MQAPSSADLQIRNPILGVSSLIRHVVSSPLSPGVMFVVDSADPGRLEEAKRTLLEVVDHEQLKGVARWSGRGG